MKAIFSPGPSFHDPEVKKLCARCKRSLPEAEFYNNKANKDGKNSYCIECHKVYIADWRATPNGHISCIASSHRRNRRYYLKNQETLKARKREYRKVYYQEHREKILAFHSLHKYYPHDIERCRLSWRLAAARRKAIKAALPATLTRDQWQAIIKAYNGRCAYCGAQTSNLTQDHVVPLIKGGPTIPSNIVPACLSCNTRKRASEPPKLPARRLLL